ncbi:glycosyltransferase family 2 protein [Collinsella sp. An2]|uniref:glycosyltransferase family 2 protein n=1 Tax=Collinsella sp. An2 TaxID=1965585 RepID=UPI000B3795F6|nr:glycosyltransferase family 2 protein [Collinsella sp. An2]OUP08628.1 glycosyl transferase [Collinsella sp. An2]
MRKIITFGIPCYNSAGDMDRCITSILEGSSYSGDIEIIIVDDGSKDETPAKADEWEARYPGIIRAVHQENGGHGIAVLSGLREAQGIYYKVVDSDDWLDSAALSTMLSILRGFVQRGTRVDLFISNYVYEKVFEHKHTAISYRSALPRKKIFTWDQIGRFRPDQNLLMHSLCYRTDVLRSANLPLPAHTFYVDNIYAYVPLPLCHTLYYADIDLYRYFIGREGQSVNESTMVKRLDQQFRVTRIMMRSYHLFDDVKSSRLRSYMMGYFTMMMTICSVFTKLSDDPAMPDNLKQLWADLRAFDERMYRHARWGLLGVGTNLPTKVGDKVTIGIYHLAGKIFKFN